MIIQAQEKYFDEMIDVWQLSVEATHDFLTRADIKKLRKDIREKYFYLDALDIYVWMNDKEVAGFLGITTGNIEMLFLAPKYFSKGIGKALLDFAKEQGCTKVGVNEQNPRAKRFYEKEGFIVKSRSELDCQGNPFPILYMELYNA